MTIKLLDCTLRDGAYVNNAEFGKPAMRGIISKLQDAHIDIIECGWLKDPEYKDGTTYYHIPSDSLPYINDKNDKIIYCAMIDWNRYDASVLPPCDGKSIDAVRVVFPLGKHDEAVKIGTDIREKGYKVLFQAANTLAYSDDDLIKLAEIMNEFKPVSLSVVDTFGAMYPADLEHIIGILDSYLNRDIELGLHAHNNQQLAFALCIRFVEILKDKRDIIVDATLSGMGRGAGNATTALASLLQAKVDMKVPQVKLLEFKDVGAIVGGEEQEMVGAYLGVEGDITGSILFLVKKDVAMHLVTKMMMGYASGEFGEMEQSAFKEISNIITGAYLNALSTMTNMCIYPTVPDLAIDMAGAILSVPAIQFGIYGDNVLLIQSQISDEIEIDGFFIMVPDVESYEKILKALGLIQ